VTAIQSIGADIADVDDRAAAAQLLDLLESNAGVQGLQPVDAPRLPYRKQKLPWLMPKAEFEMLQKNGASRRDMLRSPARRLAARVVGPFARLPESASWRWRRQQGCGDPDSNGGTEP